MWRLPRPLLHRLIRRRAGLGSLPLDRFKISLARTARDYEAAFRLVQSAYVADGIESPDSPVLRIFGHHAMREATVFVAHEGDCLVGTMTVIEDSPAGLLLDGDYPSELDALRASGSRAKLAELCGLTVVRRCTHGGVSQLLALAAIRFAAVHRGCSHVVVGVNPRAVEFYAALWGMRPFTGAQHHAHLNAPVLGLVGEYEATRAFLMRHYKRPIATGANAIDYVFGSAVFPGVSLPEVDENTLTRWKMPRETFRRLFIERTRLIDSLPPEIRAQVARQRTRATWMNTEPSVSVDEVYEALGSAEDHAPDPRAK